MYSHKRKGTEVLVSPGPAAAAVNSNTHRHRSQQHRHPQVGVVLPTTSCSSNNWQDVQAKMQDLYQRLVDQEEEECKEGENVEDCCVDEVLLAIRDIAQQKQEFEKDFSSMEQDAARIQDAVNEKVEQAKTACQIGSEQAYQMQKAVTELRATRDAAVLELEETVQSTYDVQASISHQQQHAKQLLESSHDQAAMVKQKVARLQHQIALYARVTGIKWDFDEETLLSGHVVRSTVVLDGPAFCSKRNQCTLNLLYSRLSCILFYSLFVRPRFILSRHNRPFLRKKLFVHSALTHKQCPSMRLLTSSGISWRGRLKTSLLVLLGHPCGLFYARLCARHC